jgi:transposase
MANKTISMSKVRQILGYLKQGVSLKETSRLSGVSRNTIRRYIEESKALELSWEDVQNKTDFELDVLFTKLPEVQPDLRREQLQALLPGIEKQLKRPGYTLTRLWEEYKAQHPDGYGHTQFHKHFRQYANQVKPVIPIAIGIEHKAGDKMYIDFAGKKLHITNPLTGELTEVEVFAAVLGCSQLTYVQAVRSQKKEELIHCCENALHYFGGVPQAIVPDNLKSAVIKSSKYEPIINESFAAFAEHYGLAVIPARAYRPKDKSLVEGAVKISYQRIYAELSKHTYYSLEELNQAIAALLEHYNNKHFHQRDYSRRQLFDEVERDALRPLPVYRFELLECRSVTVMKTGHVNLSADKHYYSVPFAYIGRKVKLFYNSERVDVFSRYERIASHTRDQRRFQYTTQPEHMASSHRFLTEWSPEKFIREATAMGEHVRQFIEAVLESKAHPEQAYKSCAGILNLHRKVGKERLSQACQRALGYQIYTYPIIVSILEKQLDRHAVPDVDNDDEMPEHDNIRGSEYYQ